MIENTLPPAQSKGADLSDLAYPLSPDSPFAQSLITKGKRVAFYLIDVTDLTADAIDLLMPTILVEMSERDLIPVFLTDHTDFRLFRRHNVIFEALPHVETGLD